MDNPFSHTESVALELSNVCPLAWYHSLCPLNQEMASPFRLYRPRHLPAVIVRDIVDVLCEYGYAGEIEFHQYNEPLCDPRLSELVRYAAAKCPNAQTMLLTNGYGLSVQLARELAEAGLYSLFVTLYGNGEDKAATRAFVRDEIAPVVPKCGTFNWGMDNRLDVYDSPCIGLTQPCHAPLAQITITCDANVALCCYDWRRTVTFGDLHKTRLLDCMAEMERVYAELANGIRRSDVCQRCGWSR